MEKTLDIILLLVIGGAIAWMLKTRLAGGDAPGHGKWGCWDTTYNAPPLGIEPKTYLYRFYKTADLQT